MLTRKESIVPGMATITWHDYILLLLLCELKIAEGICGQ